MKIQNENAGSRVERNIYTAILGHRSNFAVRHRPITVSHSEQEKHKLLIHNKQAWEFHQKQCVP